MVNVIFLIKFTIAIIAFPALGFILKPYIVCGVISLRGNNQSPAAITGESPCFRVGCHILSGGFCILSWMIVPKLSAFFGHNPRIMLAPPAMACRYTSLTMSLESVLCTTGNGKKFRRRRFFMIATWADFIAVRCGLNVLKTLIFRAAFFTYIAKSILRVGFSVKIFRGYRKLLFTLAALLRGYIWGILFLHVESPFDLPCSRVLITPLELLFTPVSITEMERKV